MKYRTVRQRRAVYEAMLWMATTYTYRGYFTFCHTLTKLIRTQWFSMQIDFPELYQSGPEAKHTYWYSQDEKGFKQRVACLKRAIEKCDAALMGLPILEAGRNTQKPMPVVKPED